MNKRLIFMALASMMALFLASCGGKTENETQDKKTEDTLKVVVDTLGALPVVTEEMEPGEVETGDFDTSLVGTWVEPAGSSLGDVGFTLLENGQVLPINTGFREYKNWKRIDNTLIISGVYGGGSTEGSFSDTVDIISVDAKKLVIGQDGYTVTYKKK